jgi:hypothetical protein
MAAKDPAITIIRTNTNIPNTAMATITDIIIAGNILMKQVNNVLTRQMALEFEKFYVS